jgi:hypothetical protein
MAGRAADARRAPWDVAPTALSGDSDVGKIYHAVGVALSRWEILEVALAYLHRTILQARHGPTVTAYRKAGPGPPRLRLLRGALEAQGASIPGPLLAEIAAFLDREIAPLAERRNEIAQGTAVQSANGHYLMAPGYTPRKLQWRRVPLATDVFPFRRVPFAYTAAQVAAYGEQFWEYSRRGFQLGNRVAEAREAVSPAPVPVPPEHRQ